MKPFNQKLVERINSVFGELNNDSLANEGWHALKPRLNQPASKKGMLMVALPFYAKAASVVLLLGLGWVINQELIEHSKLRFSDVTTRSKSESPKTSTPIKRTVTPSQPTKVKHPSPLVASNRYSNSSLELVALTNNAPIADMDTATPQQQPNRKQTDDSIDTTKQHLHMLPSIETQKANGFFADVTEMAQPSEASRKNGLEVGISSMLTIMEDVKANSPGISVGVFSHHKINRKIALSPGMKINVQDFNLPSIPQNSNADYLAGDIATGDAATNITSTQGRIKVVSLEIPLNVTFTLFQSRKHKLSISTGFSSLAYIQQTFEQSYSIQRNENVYNELNSSWEQVTLNRSYNVSEEYGAFKRIDLFKLVNLSVGYEIPFRKNAITIEPFIQLPIGTITSNNMYMGNGGLTVKYSLF